MKAVPVHESYPSWRRFYPHETDSFWPPVSANFSPFSMHWILVPLNFSPCSIKALRYAVPLARHFRATLCLLHVAEGPYLMSPLGPVDPASAKAFARGDAAGHLAQLATREIARQVPVDILVRNGYPRREILRVARQFYADLIVISNPGRTGVKGFLADSTTAALVRRAPCPVLIVRERGHDFVVGAKTKGDPSNPTIYPQ